MKFWGITKKIFFVIFILHLIWFFIFIFQKFPVKDFAVENLRLKFFMFLGIILVLGLLYFFVLRKIPFVHKVAFILKETFFVLYIGAVLYLLFGMLINPPITLTQMGSLISGNGLVRNSISYDAMGPNIKLAVIASEDQQFPDHDGFDIRAIKLAMKYNKKHPDKQRGASTLSQQVAKNIFLWQGRSMFRKGLEVFFTFSIEGLWTKRTILERYLNIAEMGKGVFGVQAAARAYFNKDAKDLTRQEAAMIAASLPNPKVYTVKPASSYVISRSAAIVRQMNNLDSDPDIQQIIK